MYNDDYTPMEFVVDILTRVFGHTHERATQIMLKVHTEGQPTIPINHYPAPISVGFRERGND